LTLETPPKADEGTPRRFDVELFITHPTIGPAEITAELGREASHSQRVGEPRITPKGTSLPGNYRDSRWRHSDQHEFKTQWFSEEIEKYVEGLLPHEKFLRKLRATGGTTALIIQFFDGYYGDNISCNTLAQIVALELELGIECFAVPQG
jgi:hypothetical protein